MADHILDDQTLDAEQTAPIIQYASFGNRVGAALIDFLVLLPITAFGIYNVLQLKSLPLMIIISLVGFLYKPLLEWKLNATIGKMALGMKLVDESGKGIEADQAIIRFAPWAVASIISFFVTYQVWQAPGFASMTSFMEMGAYQQGLMLNTVNTFYSIIWLVLIISIIADGKNQGLHDKMAGSYCIMKRPQP